MFVLCSANLCASTWSRENMWSPKAPKELSFLWSCSLLFFNGDSYWKMGLQIRPGWLATKPHGSTCFNLITTEIINLCYHAWIFMWVLGLHACAQILYQLSYFSSYLYFFWVYNVSLRKGALRRAYREQLLTERLVWFSRVHRCQRPSLWDWLQLLSDTDSKIAVYCWQGAIQY